jgi:cyclophilin family peptidyl-prolyl cis-trans isomerase
MIVRLLLVLLLLNVAGAALPAATKDSEPAAPATADAQARFKKSLDEFKRVLAELRALQSKYQLASPADRPALGSKFEALVAHGKEIVPELQAAAIAAFRADPKNHDAAEFLTAVSGDDLDSDRNQEAAQLIDVLRAGGYSTKGLANNAGLAAYRTDRYAEAKEELQKAAKEGAINKGAEEALKSVDECIKSWEGEQKLRAAEQQADDLPRVKLTTTKGDIIVELFENEAPITTANFIELVEKHFYDGLKFHRVLAGFMAQGGDPQGNGSGGPGYSIRCECYEPNHRSHFAGSLAMAHAGRDTGGSQFYLTFAATPNLNGKHTVFGRVIEGMNVLADLQRIDPEHPDPNFKPDEIVTATVLRKREHAYEAEKLPGR